MDSQSESSSSTSDGIPVSSSPSSHSASMLSSCKGKAEHNRASLSTRNERNEGLLPQSFSTESIPVSNTNSILSPLHRIPMQSLSKPGELPPLIYGMSYNSARDELFFADNDNCVVRAIRLGDNPSVLSDVYRGPVYSVCHVSDSDTVLVCSYEQNKRWLVALSRSENEWREGKRVQTEAPGQYDTFCRALSDSRVLVGEHDSTYMELFRVENGPLIKRLHRVALTDSTNYRCFTVSCDSDPLISVYYRWDNFVRIYRLLEDRLEKLTDFQFASPCLFLWLPNRVLATEWYENSESNSVIELELNGTRLARRCQLIGPNEGIDVWRWSAVAGGFVIFDFKSRDILYYRLQ